MPKDRFECVAQTEKNVMMCSGASHKATEKLFVPKTQIKNGMYAEMLKQKQQPELF